MRLIPALFFIALGIWIAFAKPEIAYQAFEYIDFAFTWVVENFKALVDNAKG